MEVRQLPYWSLKDALIQPRFSGTPQDAVNELDRLLTEAVKLQSVSDVSLGALLSGGIEPSCVVSLMQKLSSTPVNTYSIGFANAEFNEAPCSGRRKAFRYIAHRIFVTRNPKQLMYFPIFQRFGMNRSVIVHKFQRILLHDLRAEMLL